MISVHRQLDQTMARVKSGDSRALSRVITMIENGEPRAIGILERVYAEASHPWVIGFTGVGGAGKSTLVPLVAEHFADRGDHVGILAVDPSSPVTGGALLGDRIRGTRLHHPHIFFRSLASRQATGGLSSCIADVTRLMSAAGRSIVLIETVGAGQSEFAIQDVAHTTVVVTAPGLGDEVQAMKAGIGELAAILVVNKADLPGADDAASTLRRTLMLSNRAAQTKEGSNEPDGTRGWRWLSPVVKTSATTRTGLGALIDRLIEHRQYLERSDEYARRNLSRDRARMNQQLHALVLESGMARVRATPQWQSVEHRLQAGEVDPLRAAREIAEAALLR